MASKEDKQLAGQSSPKKDKQWARQVGAVRRALNYALETLSTQSTQAIQHIWERGDELERAGSVVDEEDEALMQSTVGPSRDEFTGSKVGTSLASTVRGFWWQIGMDTFPVQLGDNLESRESLETLVRAILDENVELSDMVALAKEWHKKVDVCEDIQCCGCCGVREFQQVQEVEVSSLELLKLNSEQVPWYRRPFAYRKYAVVYEEDGELYWLHHDLVSNSVVPLFNSCHRCLFS